MGFKWVLAAACSLALAAPAAVRAQQPRAPAAAADPDALVGTFPNFSGAVLVAKDGVPVFRRAYGLANREWGIANTPDTRFRIGSLTKAFTAAAVLQLQEAGKLSLDDPISAYYPAAPDTWTQVTIRHLLTHASGIPSYTAIPGFFAGMSRADRTPEEIIRLTQDKPLEFEPGSKYAYNNTGYILLGYVIEKASGKAYADYVRDQIFQPLGMTSSGYDRAEEIIPGRASGYDARDGRYVNTAYLSMTLPYAAGSLYSTVDDLLAWTRALQAGKVLSPGSTTAMFADQGHGYGYGWQVAEKLGRPSIGHSGGINGFISRLDSYPRDGLTVVVLSNDGNAPSGLVSDVLAAHFLGTPARSPAQEGPAAIRRILGELERGAPDYGRMSPRLASVVRTQAPDLKKMFKEVGPLRTLVLLNADPNGSDRYRAVFEKGDMEIGITVRDAAVVDNLFLHRLAAS